MSSVAPARSDGSMATQFPGDPRYSQGLNLHAGDAPSLGRPVWLSTNLLECIIQRTSLPPNFTTERNPPMMGDFGAETFMSAMNQCALLKKDKLTTADEWKSTQSRITRTQDKFSSSRHRAFLDIRDGNVPQQLVFPIVTPRDQAGHFFVGCFEFSVNASEFFVNVSIYDSLGRSQKRLRRSSTAASFVKMVNNFFNNFILYKPEFKHLQQSDAQILCWVQYRDCP